ncbi:pentapeptide repeat-containing protein [Brevundimonas sp. LPMIX5]|uniref:pentapeptide repeat-containing protein n=1 Tax=Brevundimonas sp. LPMIX5 TaxID=2305887 RepID=UPI0018F7B8F9|nr:pentapeptide repeat-containing protein [Brevundimonas sp. LPMIX5]
MAEVITIARRWFSSLPPLQIEIECAAELAPGVKLGMAVKAAFASGTVLRGADLRGADLSDADLRGADLSGAVLSGAVLPKAVQAMRPADEAEQRQRIAAVAALALKDDDALNMGDWHTCETTHCIAGWAVHQAGPAGYLLEEMMGPHAAGAILLGDEAAKHFYDSGDQARAWLETFLPDPVQPEAPYA